ncbi:MAG: glycosyltransferase family 4 protein [Leptolyngbyaceae bacterium]|nr:glycosyltransferase family 4 protein [Leptolyngbyaceae bacterium]
MRVAVYSIVPSPYQRDLFYALAHSSQVDLQVYYLEAACSDSPWPEKPLQDYEHILPGTHLQWGSSRFHLNWQVLNLKSFDAIILNGYQNIISQRILHQQAKQIPCLFWGEKMVASAAGVKGYMQRYLASGLNHCAGIAAIGTTAIQDYQKRFPNKPIYNVPYFCDLTEFRGDPLKRPNHPITILFCGQMIRRKGIDLLLNAFRQLIESGLEARLLLVGREADLPEMMTSVPIAIRQHIEYAGFQAPEALPHFFRQADLFVLPSRYDGWGVVVNQALGAGLPLICSDAVGAAHDLITPSINGTIFPAEDVTALYKALASYIHNPDSITQASQASLNKAADWSVQSGANRWVEVLRDVTSKH